MGVIVGSTGRALVLTAALLAAPGCAQLGDVLHDLPGPQGRNVVIDGEVRAVDARRGRFELRSARGTSTVNVDRSTRITYERRDYRIGALERGDLVRVWVELDGSGAAWADRVDVRQSARERNGDRADRWGRVEQLEGRVGEVDLRHGFFTIERGSRDETAVFLPEQLDKKELHRVAGLRRGERVLAEVRPISEGEAELVRLR